MIERKLLTFSVTAIFGMFLISGPALAQSADSSGQLIASGYKSMQAGDDRAAAAAFTRAVLCDPSNMSARRYLAQVQLHAGQPANAVAIMEPVVKVDPSPDNLASLADGRLALGQLDAARDAYTQALRQQPQHHQALLGLINWYLVQGDVGQARRICRVAISQSTDQAFSQALGQKMSEIEQRAKAPATRPALGA